MMLGSVGLYLLFPLVVQKIIDDVIPKHQFDQLFIFILALVLLPIGATKLQIIDSIIHNLVGGKVTDHLRRSLWKKLLRLSPAHLHRYSTGDIGNRIYSCGEVGDLYIKQQIASEYVESDFVCRYWIDHAFSSLATRHDFVDNDPTHLSDFASTRKKRQKIGEPSYKLTDRNGCLYF